MAVREMRAMKNNNFNPLRVLFYKELEIAKQPTYWASCLIMGGFIVWMYVYTPVESIQTIAQTSPEIAAYLANSYPQMFALLQPSWLFLLMWHFLSAEVFTREKVDGRLEMLMTSPLYLREIWIAKCLALFVLIYPYIILVNGLVFGLQAQIWPAQLGISPDISVSTLITGVVVGPLLAFGISALLGLLVFIVTNVNMFQSISFFLIFAVGFGGNYALFALQEKAMESLSSLITWPVFGVYLLIALLVWGIVGLLRRRLDKDRVVRHLTS